MSTVIGSVVVLCVLDTSNLPQSGIKINSCEMEGFPAIRGGRSKCSRTHTHEIVTGTAKLEILLISQGHQFLLLSHDLALLYLIQSKEN